MNQIYILFLISVLTLSCGVKGAPLPKQDSTYIFNPEPEASLKEEDLKEKGLDPEKEDSKKNEDKENES